MTTPIDTPKDDWKHYALIDDLDYRRVLGIVRMSPPAVETYTAANGWQPDKTLAREVDSDHPPILRPLTAAGLQDLLDNIGGPLPEATPAEAVDALSEAFGAAKGRDRSTAITFGTGTGRPGIYVQWLDMRTHVTVEVSANEFLPRHLRLAFADELRVLASPMAPPGLVGPNWSHAITTDDQYPKAAAAVVGALAVFGVRPAEILAALGCAAQGQSPVLTPSQRPVDAAGRQDVSTTSSPPTTRCCTHGPRS